MKYSRCDAAALIIPHKRVIALACILDIGAESVTRKIIFIKGLTQVLFSGMIAPVNSMIWRSRAIVR